MWSQALKRTSKIYAVHMCFYAELKASREGIIQYQGSLSVTEGSKPLFLLSAAKM